MERAAWALELPELQGAQSFRVEARREGDHPFQSPEVERRLGAPLRARYGVAVDLEAPQVRVRVDVRGGEALLGVQLTARPLSRRFPKASPRGSLSPVLAQALLRLGGARPGARVLDPFTGSGTIALEAADTLGRESPVYAGDLDEGRLVLAREAALASGLPWIEFRRADTRRLPHFFPQVNLILANPPHGLRLGRRSALLGLYRDFLEEAKALLPPGGRLVLLTLRPALLRRVLPPGLALRHARVVEQGGVYPRFLVLEKL
ncbi:methyltransferase [Thermus sp. LT1-2-5]|uniref:THUMP domain-containing protein n=1 Tax=Thermus sp. LT1-2-5 TaxID=3026935 RepID=UPI0030E94F6D